ncbi:MAG TPA: penicillin-binding protein 2 [Solirubrobacteraceae bacterium]|nr:penicillin-binding protein 2 [Solirubrobacteraceae bacterium]
MSALRPSEPRVPSGATPPQMAFRVSIVAMIALAMFGVVLFRLWFLQVLTGEQYVQQANANRIRSIPIPAPRGEILDRDGQPIVTSEETNAVQIVPSALPARPRARASLYVRLGHLLHMEPRHIKELVARGRVDVPYAPVTIKTDAGRGALTVLAERQNEYPGVEQRPVSIRSYPYGSMAAQVIGHVGQVSPGELKMKGFSGVPQGSIVGQEGLEYYYDSYLRGKSGVERVQVNAEGYPVASALHPIQPTAGYNVLTTLDLGLEQEGERALKEGIANARAAGKPATAGAFVALDPRNGQVLAMGSSPSYNPNRFVGPMTEREYHALEGSGGAIGPLTNLATEGAYPTGSTFKPITAMAALEAGVITPDEDLGGGSCITAGAEQFCNSGHTDYGALPLVQALTVSSDTYFFEVGERANSYGNVVQNMAHKLGVGEPTGIDLPSEFAGVVPDARWRARQDQLELACRRRRHVPSCGIVSEVRPWSVGDNMHLAVGQGDLLTDPLQMAVAYSTLANSYEKDGDGEVVVPHLGLAIEEPNGGLVQALPTPHGRKVHLNPADLSLVMEGIHGATTQPGGTSTDVWTGWNQSAFPVYGKTGTAQHENKEDQSWYMCYVGSRSRPIVIAVTVEQGGFGAETAAPIARLIASEWFKQPLKFVVGSSKTL